MPRLVTFATLGVLVLAAGEALPCGGAFGPNTTIDPAQQIVVSEHQGTETYVFNPRFCGESDSFGLILPIPSVLSQNPTLGAQSLYRDLGALAAPAIVYQQVCSSGPGYGSGSSLGTGGTAGNGSGTTVIERGQVGIFDWALLQATSVASFTDWLDTNGFPYQSDAQAAFQYYVTSGWYFVAFKVSAAGGGSGGSTGSGGSGQARSICGNFGPVMLSFSVPGGPVVPARIAAVSSSSFRWTVYTLAPDQLGLRGWSYELRFSGALPAGELTTYPSLSGVGQPGDRLTELLVTTMPDQDLVLEADPNPIDYRRTEYRYEYVSCTGGAAGNAGQAARATPVAAHQDGGCSVRRERVGRGSIVVCLCAALLSLGLFKRRRRAH
jgi:hypothetical protein